MCGIVGLVMPNLTADALDGTIRKMVEAIRLRGPDDNGQWVEPELGLALGHTRLSIVDLSPLGHQPMFSASGRFVIVFNGEIYNFKDLSQLLLQRGHAFRGSSDTEVMLAACEEWGVEESLRRFNGMFAFALWDRKDRALYLGRDRLGVKPLYYGWVNGSFLFGSELKPFEACPQFTRSINRGALTLFMRHNFVPAPHSIYEGVYKLPQGTSLKLSVADLHTRPESFSPETLQSARVKPVAYWSAKEIAERGIRQPFRGSPAEAVDQLEALLKDSIKLRMVADVPLGAFLSGGIDSSVVVALMQAQSSQPVKTFTIGFHEDQFNEAVFAKRVAEHLGTEHHELYLAPERALEVIPQLPHLWDEPFSDSSQIPTFLVSQLARKHVTVSLSGDGGDELYAGYQRYQWASRVWNSVRWIPSPLRALLAKGVTSLSQERWDRICTSLFPILPSKLRFSLPGNKLHKLARVLRKPQSEDLYRQIISHWDHPEQLVLNTQEPPSHITDKRYWAKTNDLLQHMMFLDLINYMPDDILVKVDRASMGVSLEAREPMIDYRLVEFAWTLPNSLKLSQHSTKWILREVLDRYVPRQLVERPKMGFGVPIDAWLRGPLRPWAEELLSPERIKNDGFFEPTLIAQKWQEHLSGVNNWQYHLWDVLMFQAWHHRGAV